MKSTYLVVQTHRAGVVAHNQVATGLELQPVRKDSATIYSIHNEVRKDV